MPIDYWCLLLYLQVAQRYDCLSVTVEMPFKDTAENPENTQVKPLTHICTYNCGPKKEVIDVVW